jgi:hypothetical protein
MAPATVAVWAKAADAVRDKATATNTRNGFVTKRSPAAAESISG